MITFSQNFPKSTFQKNSSQIQIHFSQTKVTHFMNRYQQRRKWPGIVKDYLVVKLESHMTVDKMCVFFTQYFVYFYVPINFKTMRIGML